MKNCLKRMLSVLLTLVMLLTAVPFAGISFSASAVDYSVGDHVSFGSYPQSKVTDSGLISSLNNAIGTWKSYGYYSGTDSYGTMVQSDYMKYADVNYEGEKYRAVTFTQCRPRYTHGSYSGSKTYQNYNGYNTNTVYWFKYEPLQWRVLDTATGLVMCETIIDSQAYSNTIYSINGEYYNNAEETNYANDYVTSSIRAWLNSDFYNTAFTNSEKASIFTTVLDNSAYPGNEQYNSASTSDKVFLLSYNEVTNSAYGFSSDSSYYDAARQAQGSDYAKAQGLWVNTSTSYYNISSWRLRSPNFHSRYACHVYIDGDADYYNFRVSSTYIGVRPALILNLSSVNSSTSGNSTVIATLNSYTIYVDKYGAEWVATVNVGGTDYPVKENTVKAETAARLEGKEVVLALSQDKVVLLNEYTEAADEQTKRGTLNNYVTTVIFNGGGPYVSGIIVDSTRYTIDSGVLDTSTADSLVGKDVMFGISNEKVKWIKGTSSVNTEPSCTIYPKSVIYKRNKTYSSDTLPVSVTLNNNCAVPGGTDILESMTALDYNVSSVTLQVENTDVLSFNGKSKITVPINKIIHAGKNLNITVDLNVNTSFEIPNDVKRLETILSCVVNATKGGKPSNYNCRKTVSIQNYAFNTQADNGNELAKAAAEMLDGISGAATLDASTSLNELLSPAIRKAIAMSLMCEVAMAKSPEDTFQEMLSTKVIDKVFGINTKWFSVNRPKDIKITVGVKTKYGDLNISFTCNTSNFDYNSMTIGSLSGIDYEITGGGGYDKLPDNIAKSGYAGYIAQANISNFAQAAYNVAKAELKKAYDIGYGNDVNTAADIIFGTSVNKILSFTKYKSVSGMMWKSMITPADTIAAFCPVDVYVYNSNNELVAAVENNSVILTDENAEISVDGDVKTIRLFDDTYRIVYKATAEGEMRVVVEEYGSSDSLLRTVEAERIPLSIGTSYSQIIYQQYLEETDYSLVSNSGNSVAPTLGLSGLHMHESDGEWETVAEATCTQVGTKCTACTVCHEWYEEVIPATNHLNAFDVPETLATCTTTGFTAGRYCSDCDTWLAGHDAVVALGHHDDNRDGKCDDCAISMSVTNCSCNCHKGGIMGFFFKFILFFQKIFGLNKICVCGISHY